jgi:hypothetical protein
MEYNTQLLIEKIDYNEISSKTDIIIENINLLDNNINKIKKKIAAISKIYMSLEKNKILTIDQNDFLLFQTQILKNEYIYYNNLYKLILNKYAVEIYELSEYVIIILISLNKLEIKDKASKTHIFNKIIRIKKPSEINYGKLNEIINSIINNLKLVDEFIKLFDKYITTINSTNKNNNLHNGNYELAILSKKHTILLEYNKYYDRFTKTIAYFKKCSESIIQQIDSTDLLKFFLTDKSI